LREFTETWIVDHEHHCDRGTWGFVGAVAAVALMALAHIGPWWTLAIALAVGWIANHCERRKIWERIRKSSAAID
jgi:hypothetical protein